MNRAAFLQLQYEMSIQAGMNQRYYQFFESRWWLCDTSAKVATAVLAVIGAILAAAALSPGHSELVDQWAFGFALLAAISAVVLNVVPFGSWEKEHRDLFRQWSDFREEIDVLELELGEGEPSELMIAEITKLRAKSHRICGQESHANAEFLRTLGRKEVKSRQPAASGEPCAAATH